MTQPAARTPVARSPAEPTRRARSRALVDGTSHQDLSELAGAVRELATALKPLEALAEHVPALVEMANVWNAGKNGGRAAWRIGEWAGVIAKWITPIFVMVTVACLLWRGKWDLVLKALAL